MIKPFSVPVVLDVFYSEVKEDVVEGVKCVLVEEFKSVLKVVVRESLSLVDEAYDFQRRQYNADVLLKHLLRKKVGDVVLWVVGEDLYVSGMNFVFGYAMYYKGAVLSVFRLSSLELIGKEAVHEVGHVLGLGHCSNRCVMRFSNTLWEAKLKPLHLCESCKQKIFSLLSR
ncbi:MAG TPA: peptidase [Thermoplasmatales archaeon]|nr:peptidase [Thermoplasmatales archaeon]